MSILIVQIQTEDSKGKTSENYVEVLVISCCWCNKHWHVSLVGVLFRVEGASVRGEAKMIIITAGIPSFLLESMDAATSM